jgi:hypothetical protein
MKESKTRVKGQLSTFKNMFSKLEIKLPSPWAS